MSRRHKLTITNCKGGLFIIYKNKHVSVSNRIKTHESKVVNKSETIKILPSKQQVLQNKNKKKQYDQTIAEEDPDFGKAHAV